MCVCEMFLDTTINNMKYINQLSEQVNLGAYKKQGKGQPTLIDWLNIDKYPFENFENKLRQHHCWWK